MKKYVVIAAAALVVFMSFVLLNRDGSEHASSDLSDSGTIATNTEKPIQDSPTFETNSTTNELSLNTIAADMDEDSLRELKKSVKVWQQSHGYFDDAGNRMFNNSYTPLDNDALQVLANSGEMFAAMILARRLYALGDMEGFVENHRLAASLGSTNSINKLGYYYRKSLSEDDLPGGHEGAIEAAAWFAVSAQMGDFAGYYGFSESVRRYALEDDESFQAICDRATSIRSELVDGRVERGLPEYSYDPIPALDDLIAQESGVIIELPPQCSL